MVLSLISYKVKYNENPDINKGDLKHESSIYEIDAFGVKILVSLGKVDKSFIKENILFVRIYLLLPTKKDGNDGNDGNDGKDELGIVSQIGIYEIEFYNKTHQDVEDEMIDKQGEVHMERLGEPLFFQSSKEIIETGKKIYPVLEPINEKRNGMEKEKEKEKEIEKARAMEKEKEIEILLEEIDLDIEDLDDKKDSKMELKISPLLESQVEKKITIILRDGFFSKQVANYHSKLLPDETKEMAESITKEYNKQLNSVNGTYNWINKYMKNSNYTITNIIPNGDCLFRVIVDAFKQIGMNTSIEILRSLVAKNTNVQQFTINRKVVLEMILYIEKLTNEMKRIKLLVNTDMKSQLKSTLLSQKKRKQLTDECFELLATYKKMDKDVNLANELKKDVFGDSFEKIDSMENYKEFILTSDYWADRDTIEILEKELNMKLIVLSDYEIGVSDPNEIIKSNKIFESNEIKKKDVFQPKYYIMTSSSGNHYRSVSYKNRKILEFSEIPYQIKLMIVQKSLSSLGGLYDSIDDFIEFKTRLGILSNDQIKKKNQKKEEEEEGEGEEIKRGEIIMDNKLYDPSCTLLFYSKSANMKPGMSSGDIIEKEYILDFIDLSGKKDWRKILDDSYLDIENPFSIDGLKYASVMHYYQGSKFKNGHPEFSKLFSLDSKNAIASDIKLCIIAASSSGKKKNTNGTLDIVRLSTIKIDSDFYPVRNLTEREKAIRAKFLHNDEYKTILLSTKKAKLNHYIGNKIPEIAISLMKVRSMI